MSKCIFIIIKIHLISILPKVFIIIIPLHQVARFHKLGCICSRG